MTVHTHVTNPLSSGYLAYLSCVESWLRVADVVVVVDGGSTDGSLDLLREWVDYDPRLLIVTPDQAAWGAGNKWAWPQIAINRQLGLEMAETDWAIQVDADHIASDLLTRSALQSALHDAPGPVCDLLVGGRRLRRWVVRRGEGLAYGIDEVTGTGLDYPIAARRTKAFRDPLTGIEKSYLVGPEVPSSGVVPIDTSAYGHYFFTESQVFYKCCRLDEAVARFVGRAPYGERLLRMRNGLVNRIIEEREHPEPVLRLIRELKPGDVHGAGRAAPSRIRDAQAMLLAGQNKVQTKRLRSRGLRGVMELDGVVDIADVYRVQDTTGFSSALRRSRRDPSTEAGDGK